MLGRIFRKILAHFSAVRRHFRLHPFSLSRGGQKVTSSGISIFFDLKNPSGGPCLRVAVSLGCYSAERTTLMDSGGSVPSDSRSM